MSVEKYGEYSYLTVADGRFLLSYWTDTKDIHYCGWHTGEISGKTIIVEEYASVDETIARVKTLGLTLYMSMAIDILESAKDAGVFLSEEQIQEILEYATDD